MPEGVKGAPSLYPCTVGDIEEVLTCRDLGPLAPRVMAVVSLVDYSPSQSAWRGHVLSESFGVRMVFKPFEEVSSRFVGFPPTRSTRRIQPPEAANGFRLALVTVDRYLRLRLLYPAYFCCFSPYRCSRRSLRKTSQQSLSSNVQPPAHQSLLSFHRESL